MLILDFYVDEPACFGVPPYLSPYCRYSAGALVDAGIPAEQIRYLTVDQWRARGKTLADEHELVVLVAGHTVPGKYLGGKIGSMAEVLEFLQWRRKHQPGGVTLLGGPIRYAAPEYREQIRDLGGLLCRGDVELYAGLLGEHAGNMASAVEAVLAKHGENLGGRRNYTQVDRWAQAGAFLTTLAPNFPYLILELETYRGCTRDVFCSFCTEAFYGRPTFRLTAGILAEVAELRRMGNRFYRLGRQADLMTYLPDMNDFRNSFPRPRPESLARLYEGIRNAAPDLALLHLDNINPGLIATFPAEAREVSRIICEHNTAGDTAAMGLESVDENVIAANDLKCSPEEARRAIEIINEYGARREDGIPKLLPGLNFIHGLPGESDVTFEKNYEFLMDLMQRGLLLRRINIRQVVDYKNTKLDHMRKDGDGDTVPRKRRRPEVLEKKFTYFRDRIRREIDQPMLLKNFPPGVKVEFVIPEGRNQGYILGRPLGSYPVTLKIPEGDPRASAAYVRMFGATPAVDHGYAAGSDDIGTRTQPLTVMVLGAEERSLVGLSWPVRINAINQRALAAIPGIGKKRASMVLLARPFANFEEFAACLERDGARVFGERGDYVFGEEDVTTEAPRSPREEVVEISRGLDR